MEYTARSNFIPFSRDYITKFILDDGELTSDRRSQFEMFCQLLKSIYHFEFHKDLEGIKSSYRMFNPDVVGGENELENQDLSIAETEFSDKIRKILIDGNYELVSNEELDAALHEEGIFPISAEVDLDSLEFYKIYYQGQGVGRSEIKSWNPFKKKEVEFEFYDRIVFLFKVKNSAYFDTRKTKLLPGVPGKIYLKYFRNIPKGDLEMIFPNPRPRMKLIHKIKIFIPLVIGFAVAMQKIVIGPYLLGSGSNPLQQGISIGLIIFLVVLGGYVHKTYNGYKKVVHNFLSEITQNLYFKDIGNNQGVLTALIDSAEEEECKEAMLAYYFLLKSDKKLGELELDNLVEEWMEEKHGTKIDFEVDDALVKLENLKLLNRSNQGALSVLGLEEALIRMDHIWDNYFQFNRMGSA